MTEPTTRRIRSTRLHRVAPRAHGIRLGAAVLTVAVLAPSLAIVPAAHAGTTTATTTATSVQSAGEIPLILAAATRPAFTPRDRPLFVAELSLDDAQAARLDELLAAYDRAFVAGLERFREAFRESRPAAGDAATRYRDEQVAMRRRMQQVLETARAEAARATDPAEASAIMRAAEEELAELRATLTERLTQFGPDAIEGRANVDAQLGRMRELAADWAAERDQLGQAMLRDVRAMLRPDQDARWPSFDRALRRRTLSLGRLAGERVDLAEILQQSVPSAEVRALAEEALRRWERDLDGALRVRNAELPRLEARLQSLAAEAEDDPGAADRLRGPAARRVQLHQTVRDITLAAADAITGALPPQSAARFQAAFDRAAFPSIARRTPVERLIEDAGGRDDLSPEEAAELERLGAAYAEQRRSADAVLRAATIDAEPSELRNRIITPDRFDQPTPPSPVSAAYRARRDLGARYAAAVRGLLGETRFAELPSARPWLR